MVTMSKVEKLVLAIAVAFAGPVSEALINLNAATFTHLSQWAAGLLVGCATALGIQIRVWQATQKPITPPSP